MLDAESEALKKRSQLQNANEPWRVMRWVVLLVFLLNWTSWFVFIHRHWDEMAQKGSIIAGVGLLVFFPFPCLQMFFGREKSPPSAVFMTYLILGLAFGVALGR